MECIRCKKIFKDDIATSAAYNYGGPHFFACPHCGQLYEYEKKITCEPSDRKCDVDDWGNKVVPNEEYYKK